MIQNIEAQYILYHDTHIDDLIITCDYDDVLVVKTKQFEQRLRMFSILSQVTNFYIITARENLIADIPNYYECGDIKKYCDKYNIKVMGIFYNIVNKIELLKLIKPHCHFEDDINIIRECTYNNIPTMMPAEFLSFDYYKNWIQSLKNNNEKHYYSDESLFLKKKLAQV